MMDMMFSSRMEESFIAEQNWTSLEQVTKDTERDFWLDSDEAVKYGLISKIISKKSELK